MRNTSFNITRSHSFSPISAFSAESKSLFLTSRFNVHETFHNKFSTPFCLIKLGDVVVEPPLQGRVVPTSKARPIQTPGP